MLKRRAMPAYSPPSRHPVAAGILSRPAHVSVCQTICSYKEDTRSVSHHSLQDAFLTCFHSSLQCRHKGKQSPPSRNRPCHDVYLMEEVTFPASYFLPVPVSQGELYDQAVSVGFKYTPVQAKGHALSLNYHIHSGATCLYKY